MATDLKEQNILLIGSGDIGHGIVERLLVKHDDVNCTLKYSTLMTLNMTVINKPPS
ncbi:MAG: hypothetical protein ACOCZS_01005 [Verrucomicrobiota bacterium]